MLCLDELSQIDAKSAGATAYMLANGAGKARAGRSGEGRKIAEWRTLFLSNGEIGIANKVAEDGRKKITAGQQVRVIDVPADAGQHLGIFEHLHEFTDPDLFARHLKSAATTCYGSLCRAFIDVIARDVTALGENVVSFCNAFIEAQCPANADGQIKRIAHRFGLVATAGELAIANGTLDWPKGEALRAAEICFRDWLRERGSIEPAEIAEGIKQIRGFIEAHGESRFADWPGILSTPIRPTINRVGFRKAQRDGNDDHYTYEYYILPEAWKSEICAGRDSGAISRAMADRGMLKTEKSGRPQVTVRLPEHKKPRRCYVVTQELFNDGPDVTPGTRSVPDGDDTKSRATGATGATNGPQASESAVSGSTATVAPASSGNATSATKLIDYDDIRRFLAGEGGPVAPVARALPQAGQAAALPNTNINQDVAQDVAHVASVTRDSEREPQPALRSPLLARSPAPVSITHCNDCSEAFGSGESGLAHIRGPLHEHCHEVRSRSLSLVPNNGPGL